MRVKKKIGVILLAGLIGIISLSVGYGFWTDRMQVNGEATLRMNVSVTHDITPAPKQH